MLLGSNRYMRRTVAIVAVLIVSMLLGCSGGPTTETKPQEQKPTGFVPQTIRIGTCVSTGSNYRLGGAMAPVLEKALGIPVAAQETGGGAENCRLVENKEIEAGLVVGPSDYFAYNGIEPFKEPHKNIRAVMVTDQNPCQIVVLADSDIRSVEDLKGRKVGVGSVGSSQDTMARAILQAHGMTYDDIGPVFQKNVGELLRDGEIDAFVSVIAIPGPYIAELASSKKIRLIPLRDEIIQKITAEQKYLVPTVVPKGTYQGVEEDVVGVGAVSTMIVHKDLDSDVVYKMVQSILQGKDQIAEAYPGARRFISEDLALKGITIPLHAGARKFFEEINHPDLDLVPSE